MQRLAKSLLLSASDLSNFLACRRRTALDLALVYELVARPAWEDPMAKVLQERGLAHERQYVETLQREGLEILDLRGDRESIGRTVQAMRDGVDVIVQAKFEHDGWLGYADVLRRVEEASDLGAWSYEVYDTKLARETKAGTILQLAIYSDLVANVQGRRPDHFYVVTPDPASPLHRYRLTDFDAYYRLVRQQLEADAARTPEQLLQSTYPEPVEHCAVCRWFQHCEKQRRRDDHLSYVAGISRLHRSELRSRGIETLTQLAQMPVPLTFHPLRGTRVVYERLQDQARLQALRRETKRPEFELLVPPELDQGLCRLPEPSPVDLFLDLEGDAFAREGGREYLFGAGGAGGTDAEDRGFEYRSWWAFDDRQEQAAFEAVIDLILERWAADPGMHIYHFGHYETSALKRLMGRYASREDAIDRLLRAERFVDLHLVVRHAIRAGVESYSIKQLEPFYTFTRDVALADAGLHRRTLEIALETNAIDAIGGEVRDAVEIYNRDDCRSTLALRDWLESLRTAVIANGHPIARPMPKAPEAPPKVSELQARVEELRAQLIHNVPAEPRDRSDEQQTRWLLAFLLDWHRREDKVAWWEYYRLRDLPEDDLYDEPKAIAGLRFVQRLHEVLNKKTGRPTGSVIDRYSFLPQEMEIQEEDELKSTDGKKFADVEVVDRDARTIDIKKGKAVADTHPTALFAHRHFSTDAMQKSLLRLAERVLSGDGTAVAGLDLLFRRAPRLTSGHFTQRGDESVLDFAVRCGLHLDSSTFSIQGPPGSGKTFTGAQMICALVAAGKRVGVTAVSHKVIRKLLDDVRAEASKRGAIVRCGHKTKSRDDEAGVVVVEENNEALALLRAEQIDVLGGTAWLWGRDEAVGVVDVLFVDEAGQMSLANVLAASQAARSVVLLGDPQQLEQPQKGSHPDGVDISALEHVLGGAKTMPGDRGLFLPITWRLAPTICDFTSEVFYENRLSPKDGLEHQAITGTGVFDGAGLWWAPVEHDRNHNWSGEEIDAVARIVEVLLAPGSQWIDERREHKPLMAGDVLVVAPYNAQVNRLRERLGAVGVRVGTVDKFQGQEAPVVIYSMTASSPADAPRGMEFLYSLNRLNVATSRARCAAIVVASPRLLEAECRTPRQMQLANALCRYRELAKGIVVVADDLFLRLQLK